MYQPFLDKNVTKAVLRPKEVLGQTICDDMEDLRGATEVGQWVKEV